MGAGGDLAPRLPQQLSDNQLTLLDDAGLPLRSHWWTLYPRGKRLSLLARVLLEHIEQTASDWYRQKRQASAAPGTRSRHRPGTGLRRSSMVAALPGRRGPDAPDHGDGQDAQHHAQRQ